MKMVVNVCGHYNPCAHAKYLEAKGERERGRRDQEITRLEKEVKRLEGCIQNLTDVCNSYRSKKDPLDNSKNL